MKKAFPSLLIAATFFAACKKQSAPKTPQTVSQTCPTGNDNITFDATTCYYGTWGLGDHDEAGDYGTSQDGKINLQSSCGWLIYNGNSGQTGRPYEVYLPPDTTVLFGWSGGFTEIEVNDKWTGSINGIKIGDSFAKFRQAFPQSVVDNHYLNSTVYSYATPSELLGQVEFLFFFTYPNGKLTNIRIGP